MAANLEHFFVFTVIPADEASSGRGVITQLFSLSLLHPQSSLLTPQVPYGQTDSKIINVTSRSCNHFFLFLNLRPLSRTKETISLSSTPQPPNKNEIKISRLLDDNPRHCPYGNIPRPPLREKLEFFFSSIISCPVLFVGRFFFIIVH